MAKFYVYVIDNRVVRYEVEATSKDKARTAVEASTSADKDFPRDEVKCIEWSVDEVLTAKQVLAQGGTLPEQKPVPVPGPLREGDKANFETLQMAGALNDLAIVSAIRKSDNEQVALVCAMERQEDQSIVPKPLAVMVEGNPFELFHDPTV